jgi:hypothetical protein
VRKLAFKSISQDRRRAEKFEVNPEDSNRAAKNFAGARGVSAVHSLMTKWALMAVAGFLGCSLFLSAQEAQRVSLFSPNGLNTRADLLGTLNAAPYAFSSLSLADRGRFSWSDAYDGIEAEPPDFLPALSAEELPNVRASTRPQRDSVEKAVVVQPKLFDYVGGEVGVLYGHSVGGKFSREVESGYILGEMGNDKTHISVGAFYENSSGNVRRFGR